MPTSTILRFCMLKKSSTNKKFRVHKSHPFYAYVLAVLTFGKFTQKLVKHQRLPNTLFLLKILIYTSFSERVAGCKLVEMHRIRTSCGDFLTQAGAILNTDAYTNRLDPADLHGIRY